MSRKFKKRLSLILVILGALTITSGYINNFKRIKYLYAVNFASSTFSKDVLIVEKYFNVDGNPTDLYHIEGCLKENNVKKSIMGHKPSLHKDKEGNYLVWYCNFKNIGYTFARKKNEIFPPKSLVNPWSDFLHLIFLSYTLSVCFMVL